jgi:hypothetical protein
MAWIIRLAWGSAEDGRYVNIPCITFCGLWARGVGRSAALFFLPLQGQWLQQNDPLPSRFASPQPFNDAAAEHPLMKKYDSTICYRNAKRRGTI